MMLCRIDIFIVSHFLKCWAKTRNQHWYFRQFICGIMVAVNLLEINKYIYIYIYVYICKHTDG